MSIQTLVEKIKEKGNPTVAGLDARLEYIPQHISGRNMMLHGETLRAAAESVVAFNCGLIDALCDIVPAVKPQAAYYELLGSYGAMALKETIDYAHAKGMYVIGDIKRNDIGATASAYAEAYLGKTRVGDTEIAPYGCDSVTVNGYLGTDGVEPFLKECRSREKSLFLLVKTSNPSSGELQNRDMEGKPLYARMAEMVAKWGEGLDTPCGLQPDRRGRRRDLSRGAEDHPRAAAEELLPRTGLRRAGRDRKGHCKCVQRRRPRRDRKFLPRHHVRVEKDRKQRRGLQGSRPRRSDPHARRHRSGHQII